MLVFVLGLGTPVAARADGFVGDTTVAAAVDTDGAGLAEAFQATASATGPVSALNVYLDPSSTARTVTLGLYTSAGTHPGSLLAQTAVTSPVTGWNTAAIPPLTVTAGTVYWIAALGTGGTLAFRDHCCGGGSPAENSAQTSLTALPATWSAGARWADGSASLYAGAPVTPPPPSTAGQWSPLMDWGIVAAHSILLRTGKLIEMDGWIAPNPARLFDPATGSLTSITNPFGLDIFCSGHATLPDGRVVIAGGHGFTATLGLDATTIFDPATNTWSAGPKLNDPRWYPTVTELGDGRLVAISGNITNTTWADTPEIYDAATNRWTRISGISTSQVHEEEYPLSFLLPSGRIFTMAASTGRSYLLDPNAPSWTAVGGVTAQNGSAVMYRPGHILYTGGGSPLNSTSPAQAGARTIDLTAATPAWSATSTMHAARYAHTLTMLPDGTVLAVGGGTNLDQQNVAGGELSSEIWDPATGTWTATAAADAPRVYHSTAVLLRDGRVLVAGGGAAEGPASPGETTAQYFSPPYLFKGARPVISSVPSSATYGSTVTVQTPDASSIRSAALVSLGADTHTLDMNQHFVPLTFAAGSGSLSVTLPASASVAPPGSYMLFLVNDAGVPAVAPLITVGPAGGSVPPPTVSVTSPAAGAVSGTVTLAATATDSGGIRDVQFTVDGAPVGPRLTASPYQTTWDSTTVAGGTHDIRAVATNTAGVSATSAAVTVTVSGPATSLAVDAQASTEGLGTQTTPAFTTTQPGDVLVAFATSDGPGTQAQTLTVAGAGLTWSLVRRVNAQGGSTELWTAKAPATLTGATVTATQARPGYDQSLTVVAFRGARGIGASATRNATSGAPSVSLTTTAAGSLVYGAGNDYDNAIARTVGAGQAKVHEWLDTAIGDTYWVQRRTTTAATGTAVAISDTSPTADRWNLAALEILAG